jgi:hypothetical protein
VHAAWGPYPDTILQFPEADLAIDLRLPVAPEALRALAHDGLGGPFAVVTACNPLGYPLGERANRRLGAVLSAVVKQHHPGARPAHGGSTDGRHLEPGWAVPVPLEEARKLAARFFQNAVFWFDGTKFVIVPVLASGPPLPLPQAPASR